MITGWPRDGAQHTGLVASDTGLKRRNPCTGKPIPLRGGGRRGPSVHMEPDGQWYMTMPLDGTLSDADMITAADIGTSFATGLPKR